TWRVARGRCTGSARSRRSDCRCARSRCSQPPRTSPEATRSAPATSCAPRTARRSRSSTRTPRAGSCSPTRSGMRGAMELALGDLYAGFYANDDEWRDRVQEAGARSGDLAWPLPLHPRYRRYVDSAFADMKNGSTLRQGSPALAAEFLQEFAGEGPWAHVDMAGPGFLERSRGDYYRVPGGTGYGVRLIAELATSLS